MFLYFELYLQTIVSKKTGSHELNRASSTRKCLKHGADTNIQLVIMTGEFDQFRMIPVERVLVLASTCC